MKAVSLFSGCGGFDLGISRLGVEFVWANDIYAPAAQAYRSLFPNAEFHLGDIRKVASFPKADVLIGCYPCTGFSEAAKRKWRERGERDLKSNTNNFLFQEFLRAIDDVQPEIFFIENVQGMISASDGWFLNEQIEGFESKGYKAKVFKLNSYELGVAQTRLRVFIVGVKNGDHSLLERVRVLVDLARVETPRQSLQDVLRGLPEWPEGDFCTAKFHGHFLTRNRKRSWDQPSYTIVANEDHVPLHPIGEPMVRVGVDNWALQGDQNRRLSWRECARIQGLPDNLNLDDRKLSEKYRVIGNSVPPKVSEAIAKATLEALSKL